jgi:hypothetical protein
MPTDPTPFDACIFALRTSRDEILQHLASAERLARAAYVTDDPAERKRLLAEACDAEYEALGDCDACGRLAVALGVEGYGDDD